jgi:hypothetical protein
MKKTSMMSKQPLEQSQEDPFADGLVAHIKDLVSNMAQGDTPWEIKKMRNVFERVVGITDAERIDILRHIDCVTIALRRRKLRTKLAEYATGNLEDVTTIPREVEALGKPETPIYAQPTASRVISGAVSSLTQNAFFKLNQSGVTNDDLDYIKAATYGHSDRP